MPDTREIVVTIKSDTGSDFAENKEPEVNVGNPGGDGKTSFGKTAVFVLGAQLAKEALNEVVAWADYSWDMNLKLNDDYIGQRQKQVAMKCINKTISTATSVFSSAMMGGAVGGPIGAVVGAVIGIGFSVASTVRENQQMAEQQNLMIRQMDEQLSYTRQRAGWSLMAASIGEDL